MNFFPAADCRQRRPGASFNKTSEKSADPKVIDAEYDAFLKDMGYDGSKKAKREEKYVPPMGDIGKALRGTTGPTLMLTTNGSAAPGAASAHARAQSAAQQAPGGMMQVGQSLKQLFSQSPFVLGH